MILYNCTEFLLYVKQMIQTGQWSWVIRPWSIDRQQDRFGQKALDRANW